MDGTTDTNVDQKTNNTGADNTNTGADNNTGVDNNTGADNTNKGADNTKAQFTQEQLNAIVAKESKRAKESMLKELGIDDLDKTKDVMTKFKEWQDSQKTEAEKLKEVADKANAELVELKSKLEKTEKSTSLMSKGVPSDNIEDVMLLMSNTGKDNFDEAFAVVSAKYPMLTKAQTDSKQTKPNVGIKTTGSVDADADARYNAMLKKALGR